MKKHEFKKGDGVLGSNTTKEQRAEILKYAYENGYKIYKSTWNKKEGYISRNEAIGFDGEDLIGYNDSVLRNPMTYPEIMTKINSQ
jgi:hypothetical protein